MLHMRDRPLRCRKLLRQLHLRQPGLLAQRAKRRVASSWVPSNAIVPAAGTLTLTTIVPFDSTVTPVTV